MNCQSVRAALFVPGSAGAEHLAALLACCDKHGWEVESISQSTRDLVTLVEAGTVSVVVSVAWRPGLADAVRRAGGELVSLRPPPASPGGPDALRMIADLVRDGRITEAEAAILAEAAAGRQNRPDDPGRRTSRIA